MPGGAQAELFESGADGADRCADVSDVAGCDAAALIEILERNRFRTR